MDGHKKHKIVFDKHCIEMELHSIRLFITYDYALVRIHVYKFKRFNENLHFLWFSLEQVRHSNFFFS